MRTRPQRAGGSEGAAEIFADLPQFDVIDGELVPRKPGDTQLAGTGA